MFRVEDALKASPIWRQSSLSRTHADGQIHLPASDEVILAASKLRRLAELTDEEPPLPVGVVAGAHRLFVSAGQNSVAAGGALTLEQLDERLAASEARISANVAAQLQPIRATLTRLEETVTRLGEKQANADAMRKNAILKSELNDSLVPISVMGATHPPGCRSDITSKGVITDLSIQKLALWENFYQFPASQTPTTIQERKDRLYSYLIGGWTGA